MKVGIITTSIDEDMDDFSSKLRPKSFNKDVEIVRCFIPMVTSSTPESVYDTIKAWLQSEEGQGCNLLEIDVNTGADVNQISVEPGTLDVEFPEIGFIYWCGLGRITIAQSEELKNGNYQGNSLGYYELAGLLGLDEPLQKKYYSWVKSSGLNENQEKDLLKGINWIKDPAEQEIKLPAGQSLSEVLNQQVNNKDLEESTLGVSAQLKKDQNDNAKSFSESDDSDPAHEGNDEQGDRED
ncbi:hypothetical protein [Pararcticibacter amylolyticus]|uniref:Uncharacterized protein n=1 Tax=Pararcticibacter amylolyticus TaxID=2173175 RepID=A0A2U2PJL2_9SPHI|nr:hypothetical protein [Pararcticibacter amylolyticus]PWG81596.1 hypothetical protein DDR33_07125 [Pararcticibacter amylolyticus]